MPTVLIVVDHLTRELFGVTLLSHYLRERGVATVLCNTLTFAEYYARYEPEAVVWPNPFWDLASVAERSLVFVLPSESGNGQRDGVAFYAGTPLTPAHTSPVFRFFCWGSAMRDVLLETGRWTAEQLVVTGSPSTDHWLLPSTGRANHRVGLTTTFRAISSSVRPAKWNVFECLDALERGGGDGNYYLPPQHAEAWMFAEASIARVMVGLVRTLAVDREIPVEIRPHAWELPDRYEYFTRLPGRRVTVRKRGTISEWFERIAVLFTFMSASSLDAVIRGIPVISLHGLIDRDALRKVPPAYRYHYDEFLWQLESYDQAAEYVDRARRGELRPCRDERAMACFLAEHFAYPRQQPAAAIVAGHIADAIVARTRTRAFHSAPSSARRRRLVDRIAHAVSPAAPATALLRYVRSRLPGQADLEFTYWPWCFRQRHAAQRTANRVVAATAGAKMIHANVSAAR